jgi:hypothetical protein
MKRQLLALLFVSAAMLSVAVEACVYRDVTPAYSYGYSHRRFNHRRPVMAAPAPAPEEALEASSPEESEGYAEGYTGEGYE